MAGIEPAMVADENVTLGSARPGHSMSTHPHSRVRRPSGGLDARLGASLDSPEDVSLRFIVRSRRSGRAPPYCAPSNRAGVQRSSRLDAGGSADVGSADGRMAVAPPRSHRQGSDLRG